MGANIPQFFGQMIGVEEDKLCKPYRPFPSGRMTLKRGQHLYSFCVVLCLVISVYNGLATVSLVYISATCLYNEVGLSMYSISKNLLCAVGYMCYCRGTTYIIGMPFVPHSSMVFTRTSLLSLGHHQPMSSTSMTAILLSGLIFSTTVRTLFMLISITSWSDTIIARDTPLISETVLGMLPLVAKPYPWYFLKALPAGHCCSWCWLSLMASSCTGNRLCSLPLSSHLFALPPP